MPSQRKARSRPGQRGVPVHDVPGRERLLEAAERLFASKGYAATSLRDILQSAGVTAPTLYYHFENKRGLFLAVFHEIRARIEAVEKDVVTGNGSSGERILLLGRTYLAMRRELADFVWTVLRVLVADSNWAERFDFWTFTMEKIRCFERLVEEGVVRGEFRSCTPRHVALALAGAVEIASRTKLLSAIEPDEMEEVLEGALKEILAGITTGRTRSRRAGPRPVARRNPSGS